MQNSLDKLTIFLIFYIWWILNIFQYQSNKLPIDKIDKTTAFKIINY